MRIITCKECGSQVSSRDNVCSYCGARLRGILHRRFGLNGCFILIILAFFVFMALGYLLPYESL
jgi:hypothetical protein